METPKRLYDRRNKDLNYRSCPYVHEKETLTWKTLITARSEAELREMRKG